jgi:hypothetical protein
MGAVMPRQAYQSTNGTEPKAINDLTPYPNPDFAYKEQSAYTDEKFAPEFYLINVKDNSKGILIDPAYNLHRIQLDMDTINQALMPAGLTATFKDAPLEENMKLAINGEPGKMVEGDYLVPIRAKNITEKWSDPQTVVIHILAHHNYPVLTIYPIVPYVEGDTTTSQTVATANAGLGEIFDPSTAINIKPNAIGGYPLDHFGLQAITTFKDGNTNATVTLTPTSEGVKNPKDSGQIYKVTVTNKGRKSVSNTFKLIVLSKGAFLRCPQVVDSIDDKGYIYASSQDSKSNTTYHFVSVYPVDLGVRGHELSLTSLVPNQVQQYFSDQYLLQCYIAVYDKTAGISLPNKSFNSKERIPPEEFTQACFSKTRTDMCTTAISGADSFDDCKLEFHR